MNDVMPFTRCHKKNCRINSLPDELLIVILSCLNFHEAVRTCILSRRWRYLWKYTSCNIEIYKGKSQCIGVGLAEKFQTLVDQALEFYPRASMEQFKIGFFYPKELPHSCIDGWIDFAITKKVKVFELNLAAEFENSCDGSFYTYTIPNVQKLLSISGEVKLLTACSALKSVRFVDVHIAQEVVEFLLSNCPLLETMSISASRSLKYLNVAGSLPKLRSMVISNCEYLKGMVVNAPSLVSFTYIGRSMPVPFKNVPLLSELNIGGRFGDSFILKIYKHANYCQNLRRLKLKLSFELSLRSKVVPDEVPQLCHLKELEMDITAKMGDSLYFFTFLIKFSPQLSKLTIRLKSLPSSERTDIWGPKRPPYVLEMMQRDRCAAESYEKEATSFCHESLEVVTIIGFIGSTSDCDLALHLLRIARSLKKMILVSDTRKRWMGKFDLENFWPLPTMEKAIRKCVKKIKAKLPPGAELVTESPGFPKKK